MAIPRQPRIPGASPVQMGQDAAPQWRQYWLAIVAYATGLPDQDILRGTRLLQPAADNVLKGTLYFVTDELVTERSNGTIWETYSGPTSLGGDVVGPASSTDGAIALFDGVTGKVIKVATGTGVVHATSGVYSASAVNLTSADVTGDLPYSNIAQIVTQMLVGRNTAGTGDQEAVTISQALDWTP